MKRYTKMVNIIKKYLQVSVFLAFFGLLVILKNYMGNSEDEGEVTVGQPNLQTPIATSNTAVSAVDLNESMFLDGTFTGSVEDAYYGNIQVQAVIQNGKIVDVIFLQYPNDNRTSIQINTESNAYLKEEAIAAQSASVNIISGASDSSFAFRKSMASALSKALK